MNITIKISDKTGNDETLVDYERWRLVSDIKLSIKTLNDASWKFLKYDSSIVKHIQDSLGDIEQGWFELFDLAEKENK